ncbi:MAG: hypothetical protein ACKOXO_06495 [Cyanobium sp.]
MAEPDPTTSTATAAATATATAAAAAMPDTIAALLLQLEIHSRDHPERVLRLRGHLPDEGEGEDEESGAVEPFELLIFRGFSSLTTHPTAFDPDRPALPEGSHIASAELLQAPLRPGAETLLTAPLPVATFLAAQAWG